MQKIIVLDCGGQYKELIARMVRKLNVYAEIMPGDVSLDQIRREAPIGIILTGGPFSVGAPGAPRCEPGIFSLGVPVLGICYGMQLMSHLLGGEVGAGEVGEYGQVEVSVEDGESLLFENLPAKFNALMSHTDIVKKLPPGFVQTAKTQNCTAACGNPERRLYAVQFHPETSHTSHGTKIMRNFLNICEAKGDYRLGSFIKTQTKAIRQQVGSQRVLLALSGGVDSSVLAALLAQALPGQVVCVFVDHGFMRLNEGDEVEAAFAGRDLHFVRVNAAGRFLKKLDGIVEPEQKRKIIGKEFIRVFEEEAEKLGDIPFLAQGTIYPDIVESGAAFGATIKSHHNVGGLPEKLKFKELVEPLRLLFKNEVREIGRRLKLPAQLITRQPFPGPGLAVRIMGNITQEKLDILRRADAIFREEIAPLRTKPSQYFAVLTDTYSVGVKGDARTFDPVIALRAVTTDDFMTATATPLPHPLLARAAARITNEIPQVSRVVYDVTSKPPATVEWE